MLSVVMGVVEFGVLADIFTPTDPSAPDAVTAPFFNVVALVKFAVLAAILIGAVVSLANVRSSYRGGESAFSGFAGLVAAFVAAVVVLNIESVFNFIIA